MSCPKCGQSRGWFLNDHRWRCSRCRYTRRLPSSQPWVSRLRRSRRYLRKLVRYFVLGVPAYRLRFEVPLSQPTIQRVYRRIREASYAATMQELQPLAGEIEADETMFGGHRPGKRGWGAEGKALVFGLYQRHGHVLTFPVPSRSQEALLSRVLAHTHPGSLCYTDDWHAYTSLSIHQAHVVVSKAKGVPRGRDHLNDIEGFWSYAKHWLYQYRGVPTTYFHLSLKEIEFRFNHREENLVPLVMKLLSRCTN